MSAASRARWRMSAMAWCVGLVALVAPTVAARQPAPATPDVRSWHVQGNVWLINAGAVNVAIQVGDDGVLVVDTGTEAVSGRILAEIQRIAPDKVMRSIELFGQHVIPAFAG